MIEACCTHSNVVISVDTGRNLTRVLHDVHESIAIQYLGGPGLVWQSAAMKLATVTRVCLVVVCSRIVVNVLMPSHAASAGWASPNVRHRITICIILVIIIIIIIIVWLVQWKMLFTRAPSTPVDSALDDRPSCQTNVAWSDVGFNRPEPIIVWSYLPGGADVQHAHLIIIVWTNPTHHPKRHTDRFNRFCTKPQFSLCSILCHPISSKFVLSVGDLDSHLIILLPEMPVTGGS